MRESKIEHLTRCYCAVTVGAIAAVGSVAVAGASAYSSSQNQKAALEQAGKKPAIVPYTPVDPSTGFTDYAKLSDGAPDAFKTASANDAVANQYYQGVIGQSDPRLATGITDAAANTAKIQEITNSYLDGQISGDVLNKVGSSSAYKALQGGFGANANQAQTRGLSARDLGTTTQALQLTGVGLANTVSQRDEEAGRYAAAINPNITRSSDIVPTPRELLARADSNNAYANGVLNANNNIAFSNTLAQTQANGVNPGLAGFSSALGTLSNPGVQRGVSSAASGISGYFGGGPDNYADYSGTGGFTSNTYSSYGGSYYNPYLDTSSYVNGQFVANPNSYGTFAGG